MTDSCARWIVLSDREAQGETLCQQDLQWRRGHAERCPACSAETRFWSQVEGILNHPTLLEAPINTLPPRALSHRRALGWAMVAATVLALGAGWYGLKRSPRPPEAGALALSAAAPSTSRLATVSGAVALGTQSAHAGSVVQPNDELKTEVGRACIVAASTIVTCLDEHSRANWVTTTNAGIEIRLTQGKVLSRLSKQPKDRPFSVHTPLGTITAQGTVFAVEVSEQQGKPQVSVRLYEGQLALKAAQQPPRFMEAPAAATLSGAVTPRALSQADEATDEPLLALSAYLHESRNQNTSVNLSLSTEPVSATITLDGVTLGHTPLSAVVAGGQHLGVELPGYAPVAEVLPRPTGQVVERLFRLTKLEPSAPASAPLPSAEGSLNDSASPSAASMLGQAQLWRSQGKFNACANAYRKLIATYPNSNEAHVSRVSLGELSLRQLGQPEAALLAFDQYLERGGPLTREARYGKIQALEQLGRKAEAEALTQVFLRNHPQSIQAETLRRKHGSR